MNALFKDGIIDLFVWVDETVTQPRRRGQRPALKESEVLTILIWDGLTEPHNTLWSVYDWVRRGYTDYFPKLPIYQKFVTHCHRTLPTLMTLAQMTLSTKAPLRLNPTALYCQSAVWCVPTGTGSPELLSVSARAIRAGIIASNYTPRLVIRTTDSHLLHPDQKDLDNGRLVASAPDVTTKNRGNFWTSQRTGSPCDLVPTKHPGILRALPAGYSCNRCIMGNLDARKLTVDVDIVWLHFIFLLKV